MSAVECVQYMIILFPYEVFSGAMALLSEKPPEGDAQAHIYLTSEGIMPGGRLAQLIKGWNLLKSKLYWFALLAKSFDTPPAL